MCLPLLCGILTNQQKNENNNNILYTHYTSNEISNKFILTPNQNEMVYLEPPDMAIDHHFVTNENYINSRNSRISMRTNSSYEDMDETDYTASSEGYMLTNEKLPRPNVFCCAEGLSVKSLLSRTGHEKVGGGSTNIPGGVCCIDQTGKSIQIITDSQGVHHTTTASTESERKVGGCIIRENGDTNDCKPETSIDHVDFNNKDNYGSASTSTIDGDLEFLDKKCDYCIKPAHSVNKLVDLRQSGGDGTISDDDFEGINIDRVRRSSYGGGRLSLPSTSSRNNDILKFVFTDHGIRVISDKEYVV